MSNVVISDAIKYIGADDKRWICLKASMPFPTECPTILMSFWMRKLR